MKIPESKLIKALAELESLAKGDDLEDADPEGGLSAEGKPLSDAAPKGRSESTKKSRAGASSPFGGSSSSSADSSSDGPPMPPPKKSKKDDKGKKVSKAKSMSSSAASSSESEDGDDDDAEKSFREQADDDETMSKGLQVNEFLEAMTDQLSLALLHVKESLAKSIAEMEERVTAHIDGEIAKSIGSRREFESRLAKAVAAIGNTIQGDLLPVVDMVKSLSDQPVGSPRGKAVLSKGEVNQPPWSGPGGNADRQLVEGSAGDYVEELQSLGTKAISDWLFKKSATNQLDSNVLVAFEADRYNVALLPAQVRKAIADDLLK
jgi:hypothetical protein